MRPPPRLGLPRGARGPAWTVPLSVLLHLVLIFGWGWRIRAPMMSLPAGQERLVLLLDEEADGDRMRETPFVAPQGRPAPVSPIGPALAATPSPGLLPLAVSPIPVGPAAADTAGRVRRGYARIGPGGAVGIWARPLPLPPQELAQRLQRTNQEIIDSMVTATVQAFLDSIALEPTSDQVRLPSWTKEVAGKLFGLDSKNIYLGDLKIPAAVLALLPLPSGINEQAALDHSMRAMREDLRIAAGRAKTLEEFKAAVRELREQKEREREFDQNQRTAPPPDEPPTP